MSDQKTISLVVHASGYEAFTDAKVAEQVALDKRGNHHLVVLDPPQPSPWYVEIYLSAGSVFHMTANPGPAMKQYGLLRGIKSDTWYCYVLAVSGSEAKEKVKEILIEMVKKAST